MKRSIVFASAAALLAVIAGVATAQTPEVAPESAQQSAPATPPSAEPASAEPNPVQSASADAAPIDGAPSTEDAALLEKAKAFYDGLDRKTGRIDIVGGKVVLVVPETHYFVGEADARRIIVDIWGNPPETAENVEGMIFERDGNAMLAGWGAVVEYRDDGHVADDEAATIDYGKLLADMQKGARDENAARKEAGYETVDIVGWAEAPHYDRASHKLYWAKALQFGGVPEQTLNYDIRALGREGVLVISFVAGMDALDSIRTAAPIVLAMPQFASGSRYEDYKEGVDKKAAYGIAGLIAGGAAVALAKKAGLLALVLAFGKKFLVLIAAGAVGLFGAIGRMFKGKKDTPE